MEVRVVGLVWREIEAALDECGCDPATIDHIKQLYRQFRALLKNRSPNTMHALVILQRALAEYCVFLRPEDVAEVSSRC